MTRPYAKLACRAILPAGQVTVNGLCGLLEGDGLLRPFATRRRAPSMVLQLLSAARHTSGGVCVTGQQNEARAAVAQIGTDDHQRLRCHVLAGTRGLIGKQRNGPIGTVKLTFLGKHTRFENFANPGRY